MGHNFLDNIGLQQAYKIAYYKAEISNFVNPFKADLKKTLSLEKECNLISIGIEYSINIESKFLT